MQLTKKSVKIEKKSVFGLDCLLRGLVDEAVGLIVVGIGSITNAFHPLGHLGELLLIYVVLAEL